MAGVAALKSGTGKFEEQLLERLVRLRHVAGTRISGAGCQWPPIAEAKRLKTIGLLIKATLDSQIESSEYETAGADLGNATKVIQTSHF